MNHHIPTTLLTVLAQPWPKIAPDNKRTDYRAAQACKTVGEISNWQEFTFANVYEAFGHILDQPYTGPLVALHLTPARTTKGLGAIKEQEFHILINLLRPALEQGRAAIASRLTPPHTQEIIEVRRDIIWGKVRPNTTFVLGSHALVMGTAKRTGDWDAHDWKGNLAHPASQLIGYACEGRTRYTYAITETELILCQAYLLPDSPGIFGIRRCNVPLNASGGGVLTPGLALWAMVLMALNDNNRHIDYDAQALHLGA